MENTSVVWRIDRRGDVRLEFGARLGPELDGRRYDSWNEPRELKRADPILCRCLLSHHCRGIVSFPAGG
jgi:hypothetical protein